MKSVILTLSFVLVFSLVANDICDIVIQPTITIISTKEVEFRIFDINVDIEETYKKNEEIVKVLKYSTQISKFKSTKLDNKPDLFKKLDLDLFYYKEFVSGINNNITGHANFNLDNDNTVQDLMIISNISCDQNYMHLKLLNPSLFNDFLYGEDYNNVLLKEHNLEDDRKLHLVLTFIILEDNPVWEIFSMIQSFKKEQVIPSRDHSLSRKDELELETEMLKDIMKDEIKSEYELRQRSIASSNRSFSNNSNYTTNKSIKQKGNPVIPNKYLKPSFLHDKSNSSINSNNSSIGSTLKRNNQKLSTFHRGKKYESDTSEPRQKKKYGIGASLNNISEEQKKPKSFLKRKDNQLPLAPKKVEASKYKSRLKQINSIAKPPLHKNTIKPSSNPPVKRDQVVENLLKSKNKAPRNQKKFKSVHNSSDEGSAKRNNVFKVPPIDLSSIDMESNDLIMSDAEFEALLYPYEPQVDKKPQIKEKPQNKFNQKNGVNMASTLKSKLKEIGNKNRENVNRDYAIKKDIQKSQIKKIAPVNQKVPNIKRVSVQNPSRKSSEEKMQNYKQATASLNQPKTANTQQKTSMIQSRIGVGSKLPGVSRIGTGIKPTKLIL